MSKTNVENVTWASDSDNVVFSLGGKKLVGVIFPATMTNSGTATMSISYDGITYYDLRENGAAAAQTCTIATGEQVYFGAGEFAYILDTFIKLTGSTTEGADRIIKVVTREI